MQAEQLEELDVGLLRHLVEPPDQLVDHVGERLDQRDVIGDAIGRILVGPDIDADDAAMMGARRKPARPVVRLVCGR